MGVFKILHYSEMECNCVRKITEGLFRNYSTLWQHECESPITVLKILYTLAGAPLNVEGPWLQAIEPIGKSGTDFTVTIGSSVVSITHILKWAWNDP